MMYTLFTLYEGICPMRALFLQRYLNLPALRTFQLQPTTDAFPFRYYYAMLYKVLIIFQTLDVLGYA